MVNALVALLTFLFPNVVLANASYQREGSYHQQLRKKVILGVAQPLTANSTSRVEPAMSMSVGEEEEAQQLMAGPGPQRDRAATAPSALV